MRNTTIKGFLYAALSSSTFGLAPFFSISLLIAGFSSFEVLTYRWGIASLILAIAGIILGEQFRISRKDWQTVFILSLVRATTSFSLVIAYQNIASITRDVPPGCLAIGNPAVNKPLPERLKHPRETQKAICP